MILNFNIEGLTTENVLSKVDSIDIYEHFLKEQIDINWKYTSPFRDDNDPSLSFIYTDKGKLLWRDWGDVSQAKPDNVFGFVMKLFNCPYFEALKIINKELQLGLDGEDTSLAIPKKHFKTIRAPLNKKKAVPIYVQRKFFTAHEIAFWEQFGISVRTLAEYNVYPVGYSSVNGYTYKKSSEGNPVFAFEFVSYKSRCYKIYAPYHEHKWLTNCPVNIIQGLDQLRIFGDLLIITKSLKDVMLLREYDYDAIAPQSESSIISVDLFNKLKDRFEKIILFYDNDAPGKIASEKFSDELGIDYILIPDEYGVKDLSDFYKKYGDEKTLKMFKSLIK